MKYIFIGISLIFLTLSLKAVPVQPPKGSYFYLPEKEIKSYEVHHLNKKMIFDDIIKIYKNTPSLNIKLLLPIKSSLKSGMILKKELMAMNIPAGVILVERANPYSFEKKNQHIMIYLKERDEETTNCDEKHLGCAVNANRHNSIIHLKSE
ncbi:hypothetical protein BJP41_07540 [Candidatus Williamhamiltonella defendens]|uniref:Uncharacterized protein n=1 Tax=Candidatus Williamhamiltonella defendens TaxID=138072 RepID=A0A2D3T3C9_9ENTR|nr:hypothetical protein [Candidatus Hamiltonella defensa]ATW30193.1 hypothetical protein BJP41_07540 [Candidatus Hamiltonella defensa]ATW32205.1 hypothetical protein BJP42_07835 [Candidatus Hamiltonella defensa]